MVLACLVRDAGVVFGVLGGNRCEIFSVGGGMVRRCFVYRSGFGV